MSPYVFRAIESTLRSQAPQLALDAAVIGFAMSYLVSLRLFSLVRSDEPRGLRLLLFLLSPLAGLWRLLLLRPLYLYSMVTCSRIGTWGTRSVIEVHTDEKTKSEAAVPVG